MKHRLGLTTAAACFAVTALAIAQTGPRDPIARDAGSSGAVQRTPESICKGLVGTAHDACMKQAADDLKRLQTNPTSATAGPNEVAPPRGTLPTQGVGNVGANTAIGAGASIGGGNPRPGPANAPGGLSPGGTIGGGTAGRAPSRP